MSPEAARLFFVSGLTFLVGIGGGALATRSIYGDGPPPLEPARQRPAECAPCPQCPACPPPVDCGELGVIPPGQEEDLEERRDLSSPEPYRPGLPASALPLAMKAVKSAISDCFADATSISGVVLLDLTATATSGGGFISEALITQTTGDVRGTEVAECIRAAAQKARFDWEGAEGDLKFKLPVKVGR